MNIYIYIYSCIFIYLKVFVLFIHIQLILSSAPPISVSILYQKSTKLCKKRCKNI